MKYLKTIFTIESAISSDIQIEKETLSTACDICAALAGYVGYESFENTDYGIIGYVQENVYNRDGLKNSIEDFPLENISVKFHTEEAENKNWNEEWENEGFRPILVGERCIIHDTHHQIDSQYPINIEIDAKQAFGTGTHDTTRMIVELLLNSELKGKRILDCGCGTGILSIIASKCGAKEIIGYDIDEWSVRNTLHNAQINNTSNITAMLGNASILETIDCSFDLVLANINRNILINDMPYWTEMMSTGSELIVSGFYIQDISKIKNRAASLGLQFILEKQSDTWAMLCFKK